MRRTAILLLAFFSFLVPPVVHGDKAPHASEKWSIDDVILAESASAFRISPDGRWVVWVKSTPDEKEGKSVDHLMLSSLTEQKEIQLTRGTESCTDPRWSPDGRLLAFLSDRPAPGNAKAADADDEEEPKTQLWLINPFGGEPWPLTEWPRDIKDYRWADPKSILFIAQEKPSWYESDIEEKDDTTTIVEDEAHEPAIRLFKIDVDSKKESRLTGNTDRIDSFELSPDGRHAVAIHDRSLRYVYDHEIKPAVYLHDLESGESKQLFQEQQYNIEAVYWTPDSKGFYAVSAFTTHPKHVWAFIWKLHHYPLESGQPVEIDLAWENGLAISWMGSNGIVVPTEDGFLALLADGVRHRAARYTRTGQTWQRQWLAGEHGKNLFALRLAPDGRTVLYQHTTASSPPRWYRARLDGPRLLDPVLLAEVPACAEVKPFARTEVVRWKGALDEEVEGLLYYPHGHEPGRKYPLITLIHGGPFGADFDAWEEDWASPANLLCSHGAFVFKPNYHGSSNYGLKWAESIANGKYYELPVADIEKGVDSLIARGLVDPERLGVMGWSNGAILTMALITQNQRYRAAAAGAGGSEWVSDWGTCEFGLAFDHYYFGKSPLEDPQLYFKLSPFYQFDKIRTPVILFQGADDRVVPPHHGWMQYRALQHLGKADVRFLLFPDEEHALEKLSHQRRKLAEELAWFEKHLFRSVKQENEALKPGSPLERALQLRKIPRQENRYGRLENGILVPETVARNGLEIGRFEVTRAQYAEFDRNYRVEPGKENFPASGISFEQAQAYCAWLSQRTGQSYRLGTVEEMEPIHEDAADEENTLDYWAGYEVNPDDAARLAECIRELGGATALLREVGSFSGSGEGEPVFDLGGNVAEWAVAANGRGRVLGSSADTPADSSSRLRPVAPGCVGFRVVKGAGP